jgi:hypothetical protein
VLPQAGLKSREETPTEGNDSGPGGWEGVATAWAEHKTIAINGSIERRESSDTQRDGGAHTKVYGAPLSAPMATKLYGF